MEKDRKGCVYREYRKRKRMYIESIEKGTNRKSMCYMDTKFNGNTN